MSRSWPRVASPCGFSNLITSAPSQARSCEQVGPACTCVMSRMRTPFSASMARLFIFRRRRVEAGDAPALRSGGLIDHGIDQRRLARSEGFVHRLAQLRRRAHVQADAAEGLDQLVVARALHEYRRRGITPRGIGVGALADGVVIHD